MFTIPLRVFHVYNSIKSIPLFKLCDITHEEEKPKRYVPILVN
jgi:hypothetical protein